MSENPEQLEHRDRQSKSGVWLVVIFVLLPLFYVISPPWLALMLGSNYYDYDWYITLYVPIIYLHDHIDLVQQFYDWYFGLFGLP